ncbi:MAG: hypothetical protein HYZ47_01890 [Simkania negevensis]|nr:hypothetical protein [Simkania negevensis]
MDRQEIPKKASRILHLVLVAFLLILIRIWYLSTIKHEEYLKISLKPQRHILIQTAPRGTIVDRFDIPLAINKVQYNAAVCYDQIREIPLITWEKGEDGKRKKIYKRREYVEKLSQFLGEKLKMDPIEIEDLIYARASLFPHAPFVIQEDLSEETYYQLQMAARQWKGIQMQMGGRRFYPQGKEGSHFLGYLGKIDQEKYFACAEELKELREFMQSQEENLPSPLPKGFKSQEEVALRLKEIEEKAYTLGDFVGKMGVEKIFDERLRGKRGKKEIEIGAGGKFIRELPNKEEPMSGEKLTLSISSALQSFAENLLIQNEEKREKQFVSAGKDHDKLSPPWIKGGSIIALLPETGEVVALASFPRFDPNDFILYGRGDKRKEKVKKIAKWLEQSDYIADLWDGKRPLEREFIFSKKSALEEKFLNWNFYLSTILSLQGNLRKMIGKVPDLKTALQLQRAVKMLMEIGHAEEISHLLHALYPSSSARKKIDPLLIDSIRENLQREEVKVEELSKVLSPYLSPLIYHEDKLLFFDLLLLAANEKLYSKPLIEEIGFFSLQELFRLKQAFLFVQDEIKKQVHLLYFSHVFPLWRKEHFKSYLHEKRQEEKENHRYARPYLDYLNEIKRTFFEQFWDNNRLLFFQTFLSGKAPSYQKNEMAPFLFHLALKSHEIAREKERRDGVELSFLKQKIGHLSASSLEALSIAALPFTELRDPLFGSYEQLGNYGRKQTTKDLASFFYPKKGVGYSKSWAYSRDTHQGSLFKIITGYEALLQTYLKRKELKLPLDHLNPFTITDETRPYQTTPMGIILGQRASGEWITRRYKGGRLPKSHTSLGKIDFQEALMRSSNLYFSLLAGEVIEHPAHLQRAAEQFGYGEKTGIELTGEIKGNMPDDLRDNKTGLYSFAIGQHSLVSTPLQSAMMLSAIANGGKVIEPTILKRSDKTPKKIREVLFFPSEVRKTLLDALLEKPPLQSLVIVLLLTEKVKHSFVKKSGSELFLLKKIPPNL